MTTSANTKYTFEDSTYEPAAGRKKQHRRTHSKDNSEGEDGDPLDGSGSLTYSAASSINSATGESTDSSFADILRVLDVQEGKEYTQKEKARMIRDERSVAAESLAYSMDTESHLPSLATDAESALNGTRYLSTIPGQPSDQYSDVGGARTAGLPMDRVDEENGILNATMDSEDLIFSPAEHTDSIKRRKDRKRRERMDKTPRTKNTKSHIAVESRQGTPPTARPPKAREAVDDTEEEDIWLAKWWMWCLSFDGQNMMPKR